ncbi:hypothetical protein [Brevibacillus brevis]|uniref:hypothetical protein n=1 Tax=Brevibacillus brevis TaxID=1393 RepID=UPI0013A6C9E4|nr:hypothetical protein [Brevibacillus brevis]
MKRTINIKFSWSTHKRILSIVDREVNNLTRLRRLPFAVWRNANVPSCLLLQTGLKLGVSDTERICSGRREQDFIAVDGRPFQLRFCSEAIGYRLKVVQSRLGWFEEQWNDLPRTSFETFSEVLSSKKSIRPKKTVLLWTIPSFLQMGEFAGENELITLLH